MPDILFEIKNRVGVITLNRPQALNAVSGEMTHAIFEQLTAWKSDPQVQTVLICSACPKAFSAGGDLRQLYEHRDNKPYLANFLKREYALNRLIHHYPKPYIALINGITMGAGVGISLHGRYRIATDDLKFAMPETAIGFFPDVGSSYLFARCPGALGLFLALTGRIISAADAQALKLIDAIIPTPALEAVKQAMIAHPEAIDDIIRKHTAPPQTSELLSQRAIIDEHFSRETLSSILQGLSLDDETFCQKIVSELRLKSPLSLAVTFHQQQLAKNYSFDECSALDFQLAQHFLMGHDFFEGIRAKMIDKTGDPQWQDDNLEAVNPSDMEAYFK